ncbi:MULTISPECIES: carboxypeptidase-like regulatory domain-containing protein [Proteiniphilum]|uniref:carboxypeptidase-like regulatory domain-containing protein n=1 Tax=Proteiniphilum TaxID=294702 RepID=UPI0028AB42FE|nr:MULTISPECIES: carboxypeptidase-like regulatory domain-containing protein [Proteiniphilum]MDY9919099.1 carboxypeptidase-like regulatory domain-containing protein [Proteiniphilum sp.]
MMNVTRHYLLIFLLICSCFSSFAQQEIKGRVLDSQNRKPVVSATVTIHPVGSSSILAYTMTAEDGTFILKRNNFPDSVTVTVSAMTIEQQSKNIKSDVAMIEFLVTEKTMELKEVVVKAPKIRQLGDTIHYDVAGFMDETDRSIGDVLEKLPGVQVLSSGQILYQNKEISKFYIEGLDLLQGKYGLATQNVDASKVASVQILENHQPIKALKGMEIPENAAINLKLKQSAMGAFFATAQLGTGLPPILLSNEAVGMRFTRSQQNMLVYKGDNTGRDISKELTSYYDHFGSRPSNLLSVIAPAPPSIREQHYLFNEAHLVSLNDLRGIKKDLILTTNINFLHDKQKSSSFSQQDIFLTPSDTLQITEDMDARLLKRELEGSVTLEGNTDNYFLNNNLNVRSSWNTHKGNIAGSEPVAQFLQLPSFHIENNFDYLRRNNSRRNRIKANIAYTTQHHSLDVLPVLFEELKNPDPRIRQDISFDRFNASASVSGHKDLQWFSFGYTTGASFLHYRMESGLLSGTIHTPVVADTLQNNISRTEAKLNFSPSFGYRPPSGLQLNFSFPLDYLFLNREDEIRQTRQKRGHLLVSPYLWIQYPFSTRLTIFSNISFSNHIGSVNEDYRGYILNTYRSLNRSDGLLSKNSRTLANVNFNYKNPFTTLFTSLRLFYNNTWRNMLYDVEYNDILSSSIGTIHPHTSHNWGAGYSIGKSIDAINSEVRFSTGYDRNQSVTLHQGVISGYSSTGYSLSPRITTDIGRWMIVKYAASYRHNRTKIRDNEMSPVNDFTQDIALSLIPAKGFTLTASVNHYYNNMIESSARSSWFGNLGARYRMKNVDWMLDWTNIFNTRQFVTYSYSAISSYYTVYELRPVEVLLRVRFKIL